MSMNPQKEQWTGRRVRRNYPQEFRREAVGMIEREGMTTAEGKCGVGNGCLGKASSITR